MRSMEISLNAAFKTADTHQICAAIDAAIHAQNNISQLARKAGLDRVTLYRAFRTVEGPTLHTVIGALDALGFQFVVQIERRPPETPPNPYAPWKSRSHPELRSNSKVAAKYLTRAFETSEINLIVEAFADTLRAQENVTQLAANTIRARTSLYRAFTAPHVPKLSTVLIFLDALGLRLAIKRRFASKDAP
jgi:probable addiction module antidote protein